MFFANECPQVGHFDGKEYQNSLCKPCWSKSNDDRHNFFVYFRDGKRVYGLTFDESYEMFTTALGTDNPCCVERSHQEIRVNNT